MPRDAFVAMDYTLDWLYAATRWNLDESVEGSKQRWPSDAELTASGEDIDLVIAWDKPPPAGGDKISFGSPFGSQRL